MRLNFFRRVRVLPNVWLNLSKGGVSVSVGVRGLRATFGRGRSRLTAGLPGSGLSVTQEQRRSDKPKPDDGERLLEKALRGK